MAGEVRSYAHHAAFNLKAAQLALQRAKALPPFTRQAAVNNAERVVRKCRAEEKAAACAAGLFDAPFEEVLY